MSVVVTRSVRCHFNSPAQQGQRMFVTGTSTGSAPATAGGASRRWKGPCPGFRPGRLGWALRLPLENGVADRALLRRSFPSFFTSSRNRSFSVRTRVNSSRRDWFSSSKSSIRWRSPSGSGPVIQTTVTDPARNVQRFLSDRQSATTEPARQCRESGTNTDDTGWRVGGRPAHLMVFVSAESTVYQIRGRHRNEEVREVIPADYAGVMGTDRGKSYDAKEFDAVAQQKCLSHLQRNLTEVLETKKGRARQFGLGLKDMLGQSIELYHKRSDLEPADYQLQVQQIDDALTFHLRHRILKDDDNQTLLDGIGLHQDRGNLLRFLHV